MTTPPADALSDEELQAQRESWARSCVSKPGDRHAIPVPSGLDPVTVEHIVALLESERQGYENLTYAGDNYMRATNTAKEAALNEALNQVRALCKPIAKEGCASPREEASDEKSAWRPIETAPRDGTFVLLYAPTRPYDGPQQVGCFLPPVEEGDQGCWWLADGRYQDRPTHWQPLPPPPVVTAGDARGEANPPLPDLP